MTTAQVKSNSCACKYCGGDYSKKEVNRIYGKDSMVSLLGYCSAQCYTKKITQNFERCTFN